MTEFPGPEGAATIRGSEPVRSCRQPGLIFVDDDDDFREAATGELEDLGFSVTSFADGNAMLVALADGLTADVVVLDWFMPAMMGSDALARLRRAGSDLPVVFLTGHSTPGLEELARRRGAADFIDKTLGIPTLAKRLRHLVE
jgi:two-component system response regulator ChvI